MIYKVPHSIIEVKSVFGNFLLARKFGDSKDEL